jgi:hypothetical protein
MFLIVIHHTAAPLAVISSSAALLNSLQTGFRVMITKLKQYLPVLSLKFRLFLL